MKILTLLILYLQFLQIFAINIGSYNIRTPVDPPPNDWPSRVWKIANLIKKYNLDIIGLQEVGYQTVNDLMNNLQGYCKVNEQIYDNAIIYKCNVFKIKKSKIIALSNNPNDIGSNSWGLVYPRAVTYAQFETNNIIYDFFATHLDITGDLNKIKLQEESIIKLVNNEKNDNGYQIIVGDFNTEYIKVFTDNDFMDSYIKNGNDGTFGGFGNPSGAKIDFILVEICSNKKNGRIIRDTVNGLYPSDHALIILENF